EVEVAGQGHEVEFQESHIGDLGGLSRTAVQALQILIAVGVDLAAHIFPGVAAAGKARLPASDKHSFGNGKSTSVIVKIRYGLCGRDLCIGHLHTSVVKKGVDQP